MKNTAEGELQTSFFISTFRPTDLGADELMNIFISPMSIKHTNVEQSIKIFIPARITLDKMPLR